MPLASSCYVLEPLEIWSVHFLNRRVKSRSMGVPQSFAARSDVAIRAGDFFRLCPVGMRVPVRQKKNVAGVRLRQRMRVLDRTKVLFGSRRYFRDVGE